MIRELTHGSLFSGIEGFGLGAALAGIKTEWSCEFEKYQTEVIKKKFGDGHTVYGDIRTLENPPFVNIISGGFPCQGISVAGKGTGIKGSRSGKDIYISLPTPCVSSAKGSLLNRFFGSPTYRGGELSRVYPGWRERRDLPEPRTFRSVNDIPNLVDRNKCLGNAVQPLMTQYLFECIKVFDTENV